VKIIAGVISGIELSLTRETISVVSFIVLQRFKQSVGSIRERKHSNELVSIP